MCFFFLSECSLARQASTQAVRARRAQASPPRGLTSSLLTRDDERRQAAPAETWYLERAEGLLPTHSCEFRVTPSPVIAWTRTSTW